MKIVTLFFDTGRGDFSNYSRNRETYYKHFMNGISNIRGEMLVVCDDSVKQELERLLNSHPKRANVAFHVVKFANLPFSEKVDDINRVLGEPAMRFYSLRDSITPLKNIFGYVCKRILNTVVGRKKLIWDFLPVGEPLAPEYKNANYLVTTWGKPWAMLQAYAMGFAKANERIIFLDFGLGHSRPEITDLFYQSKLLDSSASESKLELAIRKEIHASDSVWSIAALRDDAKVAAGVIVGNQISIESLQEFFLTSISSYMAAGLILDDQSLLALYAAKTPESVIRVSDFPEKHDGWCQVERYLIPDI